MVEFWDRCPNCGKPLVTESNLWKLRGILMISGGVLGAIVLPLMGFSTAGVAAGTAAAAWQSSIGSAGTIATGSLFSVLQSLGATGLGIILFGSVGAALGLLGTAAAKLGWCKPKASSIRTRYARDVDNKIEEQSCIDYKEHWKKNIYKAIKAWQLAKHFIG